jgi:hypothetical protein
MLTVVMLTVAVPNVDVLIAVMVNVIVECVTFFVLIIISTSAIFHSVIMPSVIGLNVMAPIQSLFDSY